MNYELKLDATLKQVQADRVVFCDEFCSAVKALKKPSLQKQQKNYFSDIYIDIQQVMG